MPSPITQTTKDTFPASVAFTPTGTTIGTFLKLSEDSTALIKGDWIYDAAQSAARRVMNKRNDLEYDLEEAFASDLSTTVIKRVPKLTTHNIMVSIAPSTATEAVIVNGQTLGVNASYTDRIPDEQASVGSRFVEVIVIDGATTNATIGYTPFKNS
jgi:hypothetical protein